MKTLNIILTLVNVAATATTIYFATNIVQPKYPRVTGDGIIGIQYKDDGWEERMRKRNEEMEKRQKEADAECEKYREEAKKYEDLLEKAKQERREFLKRHPKMRGASLIDDQL